MLQNNSYPTFLASSYKEASQALRSESVKSEIEITGEKIAKAFNLDSAQVNFLFTNFLNKEAGENDKFNQTEKAIFWAASLNHNGIIDGTYTVISSTGNHRTIELFTCTDIKSDFFGKRTVRLMIGSNNETDYKNFGFFFPKVGIKVFKKSIAENQAKRKDNPKEIDLQKTADFASSLLIDGKEGKAAKIGFRLEVSKRCMVCGRKLTNPSSLNLCMGEKCYRDVHGK